MITCTHMLHMNSFYPSDIEFVLIINPGRPWLWARLDRKPSKTGDKRLKQYQSLLQKWEQSSQDLPKPTLEWDMEKDFKVRLKKYTR